MNLSPQAEKNLDNLNSRILKAMKLNKGSQQKAIKETIKKAMSDGLVTDEIQYELCVTARLKPDNQKVVLKLGFVF